MVETIYSMSPETKGLKWSALRSIEKLLKGKSKLI